MANTIRIKRRSSSGAVGAPSTLKNGELAYNENASDNSLYYGYGDNGSGDATSIIPIAGKGAFVDLTSAQTVAGTKTFSSSPLAPTPSNGDNSTKVATTAYVDAAVGGAGGTQAQNTVYAGPASGSGTPSFRALVAADIPSLTAAKISDFSAASDARISLQKGAANGLATLDGSGLIPSTQLPSYVDDVLEFANLAAFPGTGASGIIYIAADTGRSYRWTGSIYSQILASPGSTDSVTEGSLNLYFTTARVLATLLSGLSTATNAAISATDSVLEAFGKLQAQVTARLITTNNLSDLTSASSARTNLGLGSAALLASSAVLQSANNLSDLASPASARTNLGLGTIATQNANGVNITGGTIDNVTFDGGTF
jgi:hypothetical protein